MGVVSSVDTSPSAEAGQFRYGKERAYWFPPHPHVEVCPDDTFGRETI